MELPTVWGNIKCIDGVGGVGWCNGTCDGWSVWRSVWRNVWRTETVTETVTGRGCDRGVVVWERQFWRVSPDSWDSVVTGSSLAGAWVQAVIISTSEVCFITIAMTSWSMMAVVENALDILSSRQSGWGCFFDGKVWNSHSCCICSSNVVMVWNARMFLGISFKWFVVQGMLGGESPGGLLFDISCVCWACTPLWGSSLFLPQLVKIPDTLWRMPFIMWASLKDQGAKPMDYEGLSF